MKATLNLTIPTLNLVKTYFDILPMLYCGFWVKTPCKNDSKMPMVNDLFSRNNVFMVPKAIDSVDVRPMVVLDLAPAEEQSDSPYKNNVVEFDAEDSKVLKIYGNELLEDLPPFTVCSLSGSKIAAICDGSIGTRCFDEENRAWKESSLRMWLKEKSDVSRKNN